MKLRVPNRKTSVLLVAETLVAVVIMGGVAIQSSKAEPVVAPESTSAATTLTSISSTTRYNQAAPADPTVLPPLSVRYQSDAVEEVPDFQRHVTPLLGRLGCNGRSCHGSFQGRGGFQLSLFGYDFVADHAALLDPDTGRVDVDDIEESLILAKPSDADMHEGGKLFDLGSWQHHTLRNWIRGGATFDKKNIQSLVKLDVFPREIRFTENEEAIDLVAIAHWPDGTKENVTALCRFTSNDDAIAAIDVDGRVRSGERGDTHIVVSYDRAVVPVPVMRAVQSDPGLVVPPPTSDHPIDHFIAEKLAKLGVIASAKCSDSEFIRRASLDITGTLPAAAEVRAFLADRSPDKRGQLIDDLLDSPGYAAWWATRMSDWTGNSEQQLNNALPVRGAGTRLWYEWLRVRFDDNVPYDEIVAGIVEAESVQGDESYLDYCKTMTQACQPGNEELFAAREGMPLYWARRNFAKPEERAIGFAYAFLGVRIECAQCHKHPFDQWSKNDFDEFAKLFASINARQNNVASENKEEYRELMNEITGGKKIQNGDLRKKIYEIARKGGTVPFFELTFEENRSIARSKQMAKDAKKKGKTVAVEIPTGQILGQADPIELDRDPRGALMSWLRDPANPYFARAVVNRVWANYFGIGIVNPTDDMNLGNPPSNAALLEHLATELVNHNYDLKWLHRYITTSDAYQRSTETNVTNQDDRVNFSHHLPRRLPAEVIHDAVLLATESTTDANKMRAQLDEMAIANAMASGRNSNSYVMQIFGQSVRESNCDCDRSDSPSLLQAIYLRNDFDMYRRLEDKGGWVAQACDQLGVSGPNDTKDPVAQQLKIKTQQIQQQFISRTERLRSLSGDKLQRGIEALRKEYERMAEKAAVIGYTASSFDELIKQPKSFKLSPTVTPNQKSANQWTLDQIVDEAYLRTLSRYPDTEEKEIAKSYIDESPRKSEGVSSLMWALVNTKEFIISH